MRGEDGSVVALLEPLFWDDGRRPLDRSIIDRRVDAKGLPIGWLYGRQHRCLGSMKRGMGL
jgi:hypothetical protein